MYGMYAQLLNCRQQHGSQYDDSRTGIHDHAQDQEDDNQYGQHGCGTVEVVEQEGLNSCGRLGEGQHAAECGSEGQHECQTAIGLYSACKQGGQLMDRKAGLGLLAALFIAAGVGVALNNQINLYLSGVVPSAVFFPIVNGGGLVLITASSVLFFREKLTARQWVGLALGIAATLLLCL